MKKYLEDMLLAVIAVVMVMGLILAAGTAFADKTYKRGQDQYGTVDCTNPDTREDGTPLDITEIAKIEIYVDEIEGNVDTPNGTFIMTGGCNQMQFDLQSYPSNTTFYVYGRTFDINDLISVVSPTISNSSFVIINANPKAPGQLKLSGVYMLLLE